VAVGLLVAGVVTVGAGLFASRLHDAAVMRAEAVLQSLAVAIGEQTDRALESVLTVEDHVAGRLERQMGQLNLSLLAAGSGQDVQEALKEQIAALPHVDALSILDAQGRPINMSWNWQGLSLDYSGREYFKVFQSNPGLVSFVGEPVLSKQKQQWIIPVARSVRTKEGQFAGLVVASLNVEYLLRFYEAVALDSGSAITLFRRDGVLLARFPRIDRSAAGGSFSLTSRTTELLATKRQGVLHHVSSLDGKERITGLKALNRFPLAVAASTTQEVALSGWRREASIISLFALLIDGLICVACWSAFRQIGASARLAKVEHDAARHDALTGLANRMLFLEELERKLSHETGSRPGIAVLLVDLDHFKVVNDTLGHAAGDELLTIVAARLQNAVRPTDLVARLGGDEFAILQTDVRGPNDIVNLASRVLTSVSQSYDLKDGPAAIGVSIGAAIASNSEQGASALLKQADFALYGAKASGRGVFRIFDQEMERGLKERSEFERDFQRALESDEFELHDQPQLDLKTKAIAGFEALVRWRHPKRGLLPPSEFIPLAEATGLIEPLGAWVLFRACHEAASWPIGLKVAVNLSALQFRSGQLHRFVMEALTASGLAGNQLELEITETVLLEAQDADTLLRQFRDVGISVALDDFGTGYASLIYLRKFSFQKIKIDRSFVGDMQRSLDCCNLVHGILDLAHRLNLPVVAEGVETEEQLKLLSDAGCAEVQGYLIGRPMSSSEIPAFLLRRDQRAEKVIRLVPHAPAPPVCA
jgi:diguanylate cyclase (GGDEF)-like protein